MTHPFQEMKGTSETAGHEGSWWGWRWRLCHKLTYKLPLVDANDSHTDGLLGHIPEHAGRQCIHGVPGKRRPEDEQGQAPLGPRWRDEGATVVPKSSLRCAIRSYRGGLGNTGPCSENQLEQVTPLTENEQCLLLSSTKFLFNRTRGT